MNTALIAAALTAGLVAVGGFIATDDPADPTQAVRTTVACNALGTSPYPESTSASQACFGESSSGYLDADRRYLVPRSGSR